MVSPQPQNPAHIRFACPRCSQHLSATRDQISMTAPCPNCNEVIRVPIQSTLPLRPTGPMVSPQPQNPAHIRFACPRCCQHLSATRDQISMAGACPSCNEVIRVPIQSTLPPRPLISPQNLRKIATLGVAVQLIGMVLCWTVIGGAIVGMPLRWSVFGAIVGISLLIIGRRMVTGGDANGI